MIALFAVGLLSNFAFEPADQYWQVLFDEIKQFNVSHFGLITASALIISALLTKITQRFYSSPVIYISGCFIIVALGPYMASQFEINLAVLGIVAYFAFKELIRPVISIHLNLNYHEADRATFLSSYNLTCSIGEVAAGLLAGFTVTMIGINNLFVASACVAFIIPIIYVLIRKAKRT